MPFGKRFVWATSQRNGEKWAIKIWMRRISNAKKMSIDIGKTRRPREWQLVAERKKTRKIANVEFMKNALKLRMEEPAGEPKRWALKVCFEFTVMLFDVWLPAFFFLFLFFSLVFFFFGFLLPSPYARRGNKPTGIEWCRPRRTDYDFNRWEFIVVLVVMRPLSVLHANEQKQEAERKEKNNKMTTTLTAESNGKANR